MYIKFQATFKAIHLRLKADRFQIENDKSLFWVKIKN